MRAREASEFIDPAGVIKPLSEQAAWWVKRASLRASENKAYDALSCLYQANIIMQELANCIIHVQENGK